MPTITIPKQFHNIDQDLFAIPYDAYQEFLDWQKKMKSANTFQPTKAEKQALARARKHFAKRHFTTLDELKHDLASRHRS